MSAKSIHHSSEIEGSCSTAVTANTNKAAANPPCGLSCQNRSARKPNLQHQGQLTHFGEPARRQILTFVFPQQPKISTPLYLPVYTLQHTDDFIPTSAPLDKRSQVHCQPVRVSTSVHRNIWPPYSIVCKHRGCETRAVDAKSVKARA